MRFKYGGDYHETREQALAKAEQMRLAKLDALKFE
jgi:hypothetical protein